MNRRLKYVLPVVVILFGVLASTVMIRSRRAPETRVPDVPVPLVRVQSVELEDLPLVIHSQGTVSPRTESVLMPEVPGRVIEVATSFASGGFFEKDEVLLKIDPHDYREAVIRGRAGVAQAELRLTRYLGIGLRNRDGVMRTRLSDFGAFFSVFIIIYWRPVRLQYFCS